MNALETTFAAATARLASLGEIQSRIVSGRVKSNEFFLNYEVLGDERQIGVELTQVPKLKITFLIDGKEVPESRWSAWLDRAETDPDFVGE